LESVAFIGTQQPGRLPSEQVDLFLAGARALAGAGTCLHIGGAAGAEHLAARAALDAGGRIRLFLPWERYEQEWVDRTCRQYGDQVQIRLLDRDEDREWMEAARSFQPSARLIAAGQAAMYARYFGAFQGCEVVVALPFSRTRWERTGQRLPAGRSTAMGRMEKVPVVELGSTGTLIHIAQNAGVPIIDLSQEIGRETLSRRVAIINGGAMAPLG
jgi:hypothetical protein